MATFQPDKENVLCVFFTVQKHSFGSKVILIINYELCIIGKTQKRCVLIVPYVFYLHRLKTSFYKERCSLESCRPQTYCYCGQ